MIKILCTVGPATINSLALKKLEKENVTLLRINLSHSSLKELKSYIDIIQNNVNIPICIDSEGAQIRTGIFHNGSITLRTNKQIKLISGRRSSNDSEIELTPPYILKTFRKEDLVYLDFNSVILQVVDRNNNEVACRVVQGGVVGSNKAVNLNREVSLESITKKDIEAIKLSKKLGIKNFALSFAQNKQNVNDFRQLIGKESYLISKVESNKGLENLDGIIDASDAILIDRGDLSREQPIERIPIWQKIISKNVLSKNKELFIATNLLETMINEKNPSRAELNDIMNNLMDGVSGLVLAAETAIGNNPIKSVRVINNAINEFSNYSRNKSLEISEKHSKLIHPHGGKLITSDYRHEIDFVDSYKIDISFQQLLDFYQIVNGGYSPLNGFLNADEIYSVLYNNRLLDSNIWTVPIIFQIQKSDYNNINVNEEISIRYDGDLIGSIKIDDKFLLNIDDYCKNLYGVIDGNHPGISMMQKSGQFVISGKVSVFNSFINVMANIYLGPNQSRDIMEQFQWKTIVGFHTRNIPHNGHLFIQKKAYDIVNADGLFISPMIGVVKKTDSNISDIVKCYNNLIDNCFYKKREVLLNPIQYSPRFAGSKEAIMTSLMRQNYGCTHFIVGRDHSGTGGNQPESMSLKRLYNNIKNDMDIQLIFFDEVYYSKYEKKITDNPIYDIDDKLPISGTEVRKILNSRKEFDYPILNKLVLECLT